MHPVLCDPVEPVVLTVRLGNGGRVLVPVVDPVTGAAWVGLDDPVGTGDVTGGPAEVDKLVAIDDAELDGPESDEQPVSAPALTVITIAAMVMCFIALPLGLVQC
jgi:hypothetical protein